ncbi:hypothetical protein SODALDRAFT_333732 [Sodiomyces alkalinus F11]|uniref:Uncharacterized protein n=1 Tax=Sodiomyces alkalinus (strain CBS 110278 / VKM F-3762 / F11) TaxID=1314773 RepID=A0A3N2PU11_SODAK|nr:hypothetical protein SODALDRAFT_333732 [Sodiomyces alkalinus F11]ROT37971.1 hypothetical protein SODALDRAFT_333732 [Sodiomyces alkalinus F11]
MDELPACLCSPNCSNSSTYLLPLSWQHLLHISLAQRVKTRSTRKTNRGPWTCPGTCKKHPAGTICRSTVHKRSSYFIREVGPC